MVPVGGLEPPRIAATDFESVVYTNFTTPAKTLLYKQVIYIIYGLELYEKNTAKQLLSFYNFFIIGYLNN